ncbi:hypothetical protein HPB48_020018 [Haemaphysalis longicornis]|uniref:Major facilitator superfamily (MFS) profile domain-containing protein n=1 Tax=Haemaphysalis longicornis TaxID=44386 RepID=A0A9J6H1L3_HAELO|nr:hypothetical protein HPB48_020018 [Haemaphysalis longicornis]
MGVWQRLCNDVVSHWNLVCYRRVLLAAALAVQNAGSIVIPAVAGAYADHFGRVPVVSLSVCVLLASTVGSCLVPSYVLYTILRFFCSGAVIAYCLVNAVGTFEVITHERRPLDVVFAGTLGYLLSDLWLIVTMIFEQHWAVKQATFLAPTLLALCAFLVVRESPRWLIAKGTLDAAEYVMLEGARLNRFPLPSSASLMAKLREQVNDQSPLSIADDDEEAFQECSLLRRLLIMIVSCFSLTFSLHTAIFYTVPRYKVMLEWVSVIALLLAYALVRALITKVSLVRVLRLCFLILGGTQCLLSFVINRQAILFAEGLGALSRAFVSVAIVVNIAYAFELFPTAVRASALCWTVASGRVGAVCASLVYGMRASGWEDVEFLACGCALFLSLLALRYLPRATGVECAKTETRNAFTQRESAIDYMKKTLEPQVGRRTSASRSVNTRSNSRVLMPECCSRSSLTRSLAPCGRSADDCPALNVGLRRPSNSVIALCCMRCRENQTMVR